jgi:hypothetical protein
MELPRKHHHQPAFFLSRWAVNEEQLCEMRLIRGKVVPKRRFPDGTGWIRDLYRTEGVPEEISQDLELNFMSPLDNDAAVALDRILSGKALDAEHRAAWARFLLSLLYRNPECVETIKTHMGDMWAEGTAALEPDYATSRSQHDEMTFAEATAKRLPGAPGISTANMIADIISNSRAVPDICRMRWTCVDVSRSRLSLLTSDRPVVMPLGLANPRAYIALPIGPHRLFVAAYSDQFAKALPVASHTRIVKLMNKDVIRQSRQFVWGTDDAQIEFVRKHIGAASDRVILTEAQKQEAIAAARGLQPAEAE